jgi:hypothetical protein
MNCKTLSYWLMFLIASLGISTAQIESSWLEGRWRAYQGFTAVELINNSDGTYTFTLGEYVETGTWQFDNTGLTQNWNDPTTGEATNETYDIEKLSDTAFNQSGGNLNDTVYSYSKVLEDADSTAIPSQEPLARAYTCFVSSESPLDSYADEVTLGFELSSDGRFTATSDSINDTGTFTTQTIESNVFTRYLPLEFFPSASYIYFQSDAGNPPQTLVFAADVNGVGYIFQGNSESWLRCQMQDADVEDVLAEASSLMGSLASQERAAESERLPDLTPLSEVAPGTYQCSYSRDNYNFDTGTHEPEPFEETFSLELFEGNEYIRTRNPCDDEDCTDVDNENLFVLAEGGSMTWFGGVMADNFDDHIARYGNNANGNPMLIVYEEEEDAFTGNWLYHLYQCPRVGEVVNASPSEQSTAEYQLLPSDVVAPAPTTGAGGLSGMFFYFSGDTRLENRYGANGMLNLVMVTDPPKYKYFLPDGYVYHGIYRWSYEALDCTRVKKDNTPLCDTYVISGDSITFGNGDSFSFELLGNNLEIDGKLWEYKKGAPENFTLEGTFTNTRGDSSGTVMGSTSYTFTSDRTFETDGTTSLVLTTPDTGGSQLSVSGYSEEQARTGTYIIRGYSIEFTYNSGLVETRNFSYSAGEAGEVDSIYIGGTLYY